MNAIQPGFCAHCEIECRDALGSEIYPHRPELADKLVWVCQCGARVGSHPDGRPLGTAAREDLRDARMKIHGRIDPIWQDAYREPTYADARQESDPDERRKKLAIIKRTARSRVYRYLGHQLGLDTEAMHVAMFDIETCRRAWVATRGLTYLEVREWCKSNPLPPKEPKPRKKKPASE